MCALVYRRLFPRNCLQISGVISESLFLIHKELMSRSYFLDHVKEMSSNLSKSMSKKMARRKAVVFKTLSDPTVIKAAAEKMKGKLFKRYGFLETPADQIRQIAFEKSYEPYFVVDGNYNIDYYQGRSYSIPILQDSIEVVLFDHTLKPEPAEERKQNRTIKIEGEERLIHKRKAYLVLDAKGHEVSPKRIHSAPQEKQPKKILAEIEKTGKFSFSPTWEMEVLKSKIAKRPQGIKRIVNESLEISNRTLFYIPIYTIWFQNTKTGEEKAIKFDGVTGHRFS